MPESAVQGVPKVRRERFYVHEASGYVINANAAGGGRKRAAPVAFYVLDRAYCHREVAVFPDGGRWVARGSKYVAARENAERRCAELNAWDRGVVPSDRVPRVGGSRATHAQKTTRAASMAA